MKLISIDALKPNARNARTHSKKQIRQIADSISAFGFVVPILVDEGGVIITGHGRYAAAKLLKLKQVPVLELEGLSEAKRRALALADNRIGENAGWDREILAAELPELAEILVVEGLDVSITGFSAVEIDQPIPNSSFCHRLCGAMIAVLTCRQTFRTKQFGRPSISSSALGCWKRSAPTARSGLATRC
jgi:ParB-like nuclease family protein